MSNLLGAILGVIAATIAAVSRFFYFTSGSKKERLKNAENTVKDLQKGNEAINRARNDDDTAKRLRDKYGLKE